MNDDLTAVAAGIASGEVSPVDVTQALLTRITALDTEVLAYEYVNPAALAEAHRCADELKRGVRRGPLRLLFVMAGLEPAIYVNA